MAKANIQKISEAFASNIEASKKCALWNEVGRRLTTEEIVQIHKSASAAFRNEAESLNDGLNVTKNDSKWATDFLNKLLEEK